MEIVIKKKICIWSVIAALVLIGVGVALYFGYKNSDISTLKGAVVANGIECAKIGTDILEKGGSAADAAIATLFCEGVACPQSMGLGGGFLATIYTKSTMKVESLIARETAPLAAHKNMFVNKTIEGGLAVAVPGEIRGYWHLHQKHGKLPWKTLVEPTITLCRTGHLVTAYLHRSLKKKEEKILNTPSLAEIFINPKTGRVWNQNDLIKRPKLAETLEYLANYGENAMYDGGRIGKLLAKDIQEFGGIITEQDFMEYEVRWKKPVKANLLNDYTLYSTPLPGSGPVLAFILNLMRELVTENNTLFWQRSMESFKHGYGVRTKLGDSEFVAGLDQLALNLSDLKYADDIRKLIFDDKTFTKYEYYGANFSNTEDHGTANIAVIAPNGDGITVTSTINNIFGANLRSRSTGIILNDEMDDFGTPGKTNSFELPPSPANFIRPKKMPLSSMCPSIIIDKYGDIRMLIGAAGGSKITTSVASIIMKHLFLNHRLNESVQSLRLHHQLAPMRIQYEEDFDPDILAELQKIGHELEKISHTRGFASLTAISIIDGTPWPVYDFRRNGSTSVV